MANFATVADVESRFRTLSESERTVADALLVDGSALIRRRVSDVDTRIVDDFDFLDLVRAVLTGMVLRVLRNPDGLRSGQIDDYSFTRGDAATGALTLTDEEVVLLGGASLSQGAFTISPTYVAPEDV